MKRLLLSLLLIFIMVAGCVQVTDNQTPTIDSFDADPGSITAGESSTLSWSISGATTVSIDQEIGDVALTGTRVVSPSTTTTYTLTATNDAGSVTATAQVVVTTEDGDQTPTIDSFDADPGSISEGESSTLSWGVSEATTVNIDQDIGDVALTGTRVVSTSTTTTYTLTATNDAGSVTATAQVVVTTEAEYTETLYSIAEEDGSVREGGGGLATYDLLVGDDITNRARQCFLSFDISGIPSGATIKYASLDVKVEAKIGMPFAHLGSLRVYNDQYGTLGDSDFTSGFPSGQMYTYYLVPTGPFSSDELIDKLQDRVDDGDSRFQVRMQFEKHTDFNENIDALRFSMPKLVITYEE